MSVAYMWSGDLCSYVCFITTQLTTVDSFITVILYNLSLPNYCYYYNSSWYWDCTVCTVLCSILNMCLWQVSLVWWVLEPGWCSWPTVRLLLQCIRLSNGSIFWDRSRSCSSSGFPLTFEPSAATSTVSAFSFLQIINFLLII